jgi:hypothetical protein
MKKSVEDSINALVAKAKKDRWKAKASSASRNGSSLHKIIKTKEQANTFMKLLQSS